MNRKRCLRNIVVHPCTGTEHRTGKASLLYFPCGLDSLSECLCSIGLSAVKSGRNDILVNGRKVSGNAFQMLPGRSIVHGTLLYSTDLDALEEAIRPPVEKLERHGVSSVRQRVANLSEILEPSVISSISDLEKHVIGYFADEELCLTNEQQNLIEQMSDEYIKY